MKILVNNEEVVSNSNLQIKEEMLSTSSTILKNCYPKTWEEDKDYVSRYYFPKDYSKCKIINEIEHPEIPGTTTKGTNLNINYDDSLKWELNGLFGDTFQNTYTGKNLNIYPYATTGGAGNGITFTINTDGTVILNGKNNGNGNSSKYFYNNANNPLILPAGTYYMAKPSNTNVTYVMYDGTSYYNFNNNNNYSWTFNEQKSIRTFYIQVAKNNTTQFSYLKVYPMLSTTQYTENDYEPYVGGVPSPNPDYPQPIENVTGLQNIEVCGKNLFDKNNANKLDGYINSAGTITSEAANKTIYIPCKSSTTYTVSKIASTRFGIASYSTTPQIGSTTSNFTRDSATHLTLTTGSSDTYLVVWYYNSNTDTLTEEQLLDSIQIEIGSTATTYEPYTETTYEVNLGKNLFNGTLYQGQWGDDGVFITSTRRITNVPQNNTSSFLLKKGTYTLSINDLESCTMYTKDSNGNFIDKFSNVWNSLPFTFTLTQDGYLYFTARKNDNTVLTPSDYNVQIEKGSTATSYSEYFTPIELNKIGNYQDRIYKDNGKWYIEKQIGKVVLDGSENWGLFFSTNGVFLCNTLITSINNATTINCISNYYSNEYSRAYVRSHLDTIDNACATNGGELILANKSITSVSNFKTWLSTHNTEVDYVLATPSYTEITNEDLINQLEAIYYDILNNGINNIIISSENLSMPIEIHYNFKEAWTEEELIFSGLVKNTGKISLNPRQPHYVDLQILDFKDLLSTGETLNYVISGKTITEAINQVVSSISDYGFVVGNINIVNPNELIGAYSTLNKTAYDVFQYIADITQSRWSTRVIDENTIAIDFNDPSLMEEGTPIESTQEFYEDNEINDISFSYSTNDYRNKQIITSDEVYGNVLQTETKVADGYTKTFVCENKIGTITGITLNGVNATFITKSDEALGLSGDFIYQPGETTFISSNTIATGGVIVISYYPIVKGREIVINSTEISRINNQINRKGTISRYENRNDSTSSQELIKIGQSYIKYKGQAEITLKVVSTKNIWNIGQIVSYDAPLEELTTDYMVKSKTIDMYLNANKTFYTYELTSNYNYENAINYFDNQRAKNQGNIGEGETITRNIDLESTALIKFYDTSIEELSIGTDSTLDFQLDSVII